MIHRETLDILETRLSSPPKPLLILGAAGTGKSTLVKQFAANFHTLLTADLSTEADRQIFSREEAPAETLKALFFLKNRDPRHKRTLVFMREVQECPRAFAWLSRWQDDSLPYHVVATASVRTEAVDGILAGGAADLLFLPPLTFGEFLQACGDEPSLDAFREVPVPYYAYEKLLNWFHRYALIGGMPAVVNRYATSRQLPALRPLYESVLETLDARAGSLARSVRHRDLLSAVLQNAFPYAATRITFNGFANLGCRSREAGDAFRTLERSLALTLLRPAVDGSLPANSSTPGSERSPRLQLLDTGLVNYFSGIQKPLFNSHDMNAIFEGQIARQVVGQEILASIAAGNAAAGTHTLPDLHFWTRSKAQSTAEVDFLVPHDDLLIPVTVRSGEPGRLRSLHQFVDMAQHPFAVRLHAGQLGVSHAKTLRGKTFFLLNLPYFLAGKIHEHLKGFIRLAGK